LLWLQTGWPLNKSNKTHNYRAPSVTHAVDSGRDAALLRILCRGGQNGHSNCTAWLQSGVRIRQILAAIELGSVSTVEKRKNSHLRKLWIRVIQMSSSTINNFVYLTLELLGTIQHLILLATKLPFKTVGKSRAILVEGRGGLYGCERIIHFLATG
jgi:hypothetical protein